MRKEERNTHLPTDVNTALHARARVFKGKVAGKGTCNAEIDPYKFVLRFALPYKNARNKIFSLYFSEFGNVMGTSPSS